MCVCVFPKKLHSSILILQGMSKEDLVALKSRLNTIRRRAENLPSTSSPKKTPVAEDVDAASRTPPVCIDIAALKKRVVRAQEISAKSTNVSKKTTQEKEGKTEAGNTEAQDR